METQSTSNDRADVLILAPQPFYQERGTPIAVRLLTEELAEAGYKVDLLTYHEGLPFAYKGVTLHRTCGLPGLKGLKPGFSLKKRDKNGKIPVRFSCRSRGVLPFCPQYNPSHGFLL